MRLIGTLRNTVHGAPISAIGTSGSQRRSLVGVPAEERREVAELADALGGGDEWGLSVTTASAYLEPDRFTERLMPPAIALLDTILSLTDVRVSRVLARMRPCPSRRRRSSRSALRSAAVCACSPASPAADPRELGLAFGLISRPICRRGGVLRRARSGYVGATVGSIRRDADGSALGGVRLPDLAVGRARFIAADFSVEVLPGTGLFGLTGATVDLACEPSPGSTTGEPRFRNHGDYVRRSGHVTNELRGAGFLLAADAEALKQQAAESTVGQSGSCAG